MPLTVDRLQTLRQIQSRADTREGEAPAEPRVPVNRHSSEFRFIGASDAGREWHSDN
ncbi:MAG: hypothetical protein U0992_23390 [Planctomycetaceae bacterium]